MCVCVSVCFQAMSYNVCLNVKSNMPTDHKQCFPDFFDSSFLQIKILGFQDIWCDLLLCPLGGAVTV